MKSKFAVLMDSRHEWRLVSHKVVATVLIECLEISKSSQNPELIQIPVRQSRVPSMFTQVTELIPETYLYLSCDCNLWKHQKRLVFPLHLALFRLVGLSKRKIIQPSLNSQPLFGSCPGSLEGPWERAEKRLGVQAIFNLLSLLLQDFLLL